MITSIYAGLLGFMLILLSFHVIRIRWREGAPIGDKNSLDLQRAIRAHANFVEYTPFFLILLFLYENADYPAYGVNIFGILFIIGRFSHALSLIRLEQYENENWAKGYYGYFRTIGMVISFSILIFLSLINLYSGFII